MKKYKVIYEGYDFYDNVTRREKYFPSKFEAIRFAKRIQSEGHYARVFEIIETVNVIWEDWKWRNMK